MGDLRWAVLGTGRIAAGVAPRIGRAPGNRVTAVASRDVQRAREFVARLPAELAGVRAMDQEALASDREIDAVYITLPHSLHAEWCVRMLESGKHVLCEKPLCATRGEAEGIAEAALHAGKICVEGFMYMHHPQTVRLEELARPGGPLGRIVLIRSNRNVNQADPYVLNSRMSHALRGGALMDLGCYPLSLALHVTGEHPEWSTLRASATLACWEGDASGGRIVRRADGTSPAGGGGEGECVDESCSFSFAFSGGTRFEGSCSFTQGAPNGASVFFEMIGDRGRAFTTHPFSPDADRQVLTVAIDGVAREEVFERGGDKFVNQFARFAQAARGEVDPLPLIEWSIVEAETIERIHAAIGVRW